MGRATYWLMLANVLTFVAELLFAEQMLAHFALWPVGHYFVPELQSVVGFQPWQPLTSAFMHGSFLHLFLNMFALVMFGRDVERSLGTPAYLRLYAAAVLSAALVQLIVSTASSDSGPHATVGASGGVFGILLAFGMLFPRRWVVPLFPPIPLRAWLFVLIYGGIELVNGVLGTSAGVAHFAHLGGMLGAYLLLRRWRRERASDAW
jgi:membrane associated rhomboid family serine protease